LTRRVALMEAMGHDSRCLVVWPSAEVGASILISLARAAEQHLRIDIVGRGSFLKYPSSNVGPHSNELVMRPSKDFCKSNVLIQRGSWRWFGEWLCEKSFIFYTSANLWFNY
jgi:hypothetical protein